MQASEVRERQRVEPPVAAAEAPATSAGERSQLPAATDESCAAASSRGPGVRTWLIGGVAVAALAAYAGWDWLVATGVATVLVAVGPCLLMCALGLCMGRSKPKGEMLLTEIRRTYETNTVEPPKHG